MLAVSGGDSGRTAERYESGGEQVERLSVDSSFSGSGMGEMNN